MAIANIIVRGGYGPTASIPLLITHGLFGSSPVPEVTTTGGFGLRRHRPTAEERRAAAAIEKAWDDHAAKRIADDKALDVAITARLDDIMDRHLGIVRPKETPPPITVETVIAAIPTESARSLDLGRLEGELSEIRRLLGQHHARMVEIERRRVEQGEIEMMILAGI